MADYGNDQYLWEHGILKGHEGHGCKWDGGGEEPCPYDGTQTSIDMTSISESKDVDPDDPDSKDPYPDEVNPKDLLGVKKAPLHLVPPALRILAAPAMAVGAERYGPYNWREKPVKMSVYLAALQRHIDALWDGEDYAEDSGVRHDAHAAACLAIIADARGVGNLIDDRPAKGPAPRLLKEQDGT